MKFFNKIWTIFCVVIVVNLIILIAFCIKQCVRIEHEQTTSPVEEIRIDSLIRENEAIIIEIGNLDSIKNAKVIEIENLDNDSTLKLFYQLIGK